MRSFPEKFPEDEYEERVGEWECAGFQVREETLPTGQRKLSVTDREDIVKENGISITPHKTYLLYEGKGWLDANVIRMSEMIAAMIKRGDDLP